MKRRIESLIAFVLVVAFSFSGFAAKYEKLEMEMFPQPKKGFKQVYIQLPIKKNEDNLRVEVLVGKNMEVDCNEHFMIGQIHERNLDGWGYNYYEVISDGNAASTRMACPDNKMRNEFVTMPSLTLRYNSKLPIVVYVPNDMDVKYRIWKADKKMNNGKVNVVGAELSNKEVEDKKWKLVELNGQKVEGDAESHYIIFHSENNKLEAKAGCNMMSLDYEIKNELQLKVGDGMSTMMICPDSIEDEFKEMLKRVDNLSVGNGVLTLNKARMAPLAKFELVR